MFQVPTGTGGVMAMVMMLSSGRDSENELYKGKVVSPYPLFLVCGM